MEPLLMEILCADCGCRVDGGVILEPCGDHPRCRCEDLPAQEVGGS
jgi:hypothetical protein